MSINLFWGIDWLGALFAGRFGGPASCGEVRDPNERPATADKSASAAYMQESAAARALSLCLAGPFQLTVWRRELAPATGTRVQSARLDLSIVTVPCTVPNKGASKLHLAPEKS